MINIRNRTEFSFNYATGRIADVLAAQAPSVKWAGIADRHGTWGHVRWAKACKVSGVKPIFGVELAVVIDPANKVKGAQTPNFMTFLARNQKGLVELYKLVSDATSESNYYYNPRISYRMVNGLSGNVIVLSGQCPNWSMLRRQVYAEVNASSYLHPKGTKLIATNDNLYPNVDDLSVYQIILENKAQMSTAPRHILPEWEWRALMAQAGYTPRELSEALHNAEAVAEGCSAELPRGTMVKPKSQHTLKQLCLAGARDRKINLNNKAYSERLVRELTLIHEKKFEDYFYVVTDMVRYAKEQMFVGPARGSSCGSLVCYLLGITDIDPMPYGLLFERFIDVNREDLPDIDIDFQDDRRELVFDYLRSKYGEANVGRLGNINVFKTKSAISQTAKQLQVPVWELEDLKKSIIERSSGDARAQFCIADTFEQLDIGKRTIEKYPELALAAKLEGHASHSGMHAAAIVITSNALTNYCASDYKKGVIMLDKKDATDLNLLKIDALGLRTLSVLADTLEQVSWPREKLINWPKDDQKAFNILNDGKFSGVFQFEGYALQSVAKQMSGSTRGIKKFEDVAHITALARPGPFNSGATSQFIDRHAGRSKPTPLHPLLADITKISLGVIVYQEQVMQIARDIGALSWEDVSELRRAMSKNLGEEYFNLFWLKFYKGSVKKHNLSHDEAEVIWKNINTMGSWAFNRSHAIAYGTISYWCCVLKAYHPLEFAAACLRNSKDDDQSIKILRELSREGYQYVPFDAFLSETNWSVKDGKLIGGLTGLKQVGEKIAAEIVRKRATHNTGHAIPFTPRETRLLQMGETPWDKIFEAEDLWGHIYKNPSAYGVESKLWRLAEITKAVEGDKDHKDLSVVFIGKLKTKNLRDHNEIKNLAKRNGRMMNGQTLYLNLTVEDDTENNRLITIGRKLYERYGKPIIEDSRIGDWFLWKCSVVDNHLFVERCRKITGAEKFTKRIPKTAKK